MANLATTKDRALQLFETNQKQIEEVISSCSIVKLTEMTPMSRMVALSVGMKQLRDLLTTEIVEAVFMPLQCSHLGFCTDRDNPPWNATPDEVKNWVRGYSASVVRDVSIEAFTHGFYMTGNEVNIIAKNMYAAKAGVMRKVREWTGLQSLLITPGAIAMAQDEKSARIAMLAQWTIGGKAFELRRDIARAADGKTVDLDSRFQIRVNKQMGSDAIVGKATRKMYAAILDQLMGGIVSIPMADVLDVDGSVVTEPTREPAAPESDGRRTTPQGMDLRGNDRQKRTSQPPDPDLDGRDK